jgi:hypothetical protein
MDSTAASPSKKIQSNGNNTRRRNFKIQRLKNR